MPDSGIFRATAPLALPDEEGGAMAGESAREIANRSRAKADHLLRFAERYERGADGESRTSQRLAALPPGWMVIDDVRWPGRQLANIDHIAVGPGGVFVIDSKNWSGRVAVDRGTLRQNGRSREATVAACADAALAVAELLRPLCRHVFPVLCFVHDEPLSGWARDVMVSSIDNVNTMLCTRPAVLTSAQVLAAHKRLQKELPRTRLRGPRSHASSQLGEVPVRQPGSGRRHNKRNRRSAWVQLVKLVVALGFMIFVVAARPQLASAIGHVVADLIAHSASR